MGRTKSAVRKFAHKAYIPPKKKNAVERRPERSGEREVSAGPSRAAPSPLPVIQFVNRMAYNNIHPHQDIIDSIRDIRIVLNRVSPPLPERGDVINVEERDGVNNLGEREEDGYNVEEREDGNNVEDIEQEDLGAQPSNSASHSSNSSPERSGENTLSRLRTRRDSASIKDSMEIRNMTTIKLRNRNIVRPWPLSDVVKAKRRATRALMEITQHTPSSESVDENRPLTYFINKNKQKQIPLESLRNFRIPTSKTKSSRKTLKQNISIGSLATNARKGKSIKRPLVFSPSSNKEEGASTSKKQRASVSNSFESGTNVSAKPKIQKRKKSKKLHIKKAAFKKVRGNSSNGPDVTQEDEGTRRIETRSRTLKNADLTNYSNSVRSELENLLPSAPSCDSLSTFIIDLIDWKEKSQPEFDTESCTTTSTTTTSTPNVSKDEERSQDTTKDIEARVNRWLTKIRFPNSKSAVPTPNSVFKMPGMPLWRSDPTQPPSAAGSSVSQALLTPRELACRNFCVAWNFKKLIQIEYNRNLIKEFCGECTRCKLMFKKVICVPPKNVEDPVAVSRFGSAADVYEFNAERDDNPDTDPIAPYRGARTDENQLTARSNGNRMNVEKRNIFEDISKNPDYFQLIKEHMTLQGRKIYRVANIIKDKFNYPSKISFKAQMIISQVISILLESTSGPIIEDNSRRLSTHSDTRQTNPEPSTSMGPVIDENIQQPSTSMGPLMKEITQQPSTSTGTVIEENIQQPSTSKAPLIKEIKPQPSTSKAPLIKEIKPEPSTSTGPLIKKIKPQPSTKMGLTLRNNRQLPLTPTRMVRPIRSAVKAKGKIRASLCQVQVNIKTPTSDELNKSRPATSDNTHGYLEESKKITAKVVDFAKSPVKLTLQIKQTYPNIGLCGIKPPPNFKPTCNINDTLSSFKVTNLYIHRMLQRWSPLTRELCTIRSLQDPKTQQSPLFAGLEVDLVKLFHTVQAEKGIEVVNFEVGNWEIIKQKMGLYYPNKINTKLQNIYFKYLLEYNSLTSQERATLMEQVDECWSARQARAQMRLLRPLHRQVRLLRRSSLDEDAPVGMELACAEAEDCVTNGRSCDLKTFNKLAQQVQNTYFPNKPNPKLEEVERQFWDIVMSANAHVCVHSASVDTSEHGYGFPANRSMPYGNHPWNLKHLGVSPLNLLSYLGPTPGVSSTSLQYGMLFSASCWHMDPTKVPYIEYLHEGPPKIWYSISADQHDLFRHAAESICPYAVLNKDIWLPCDLMLIPPCMLVEYGIKVTRHVQNAGEFVVVYPNTYCASISTGYTVAEGAYFAPHDWINTAESIYLNLRNNCEPSLFSMHKLLIAMAENPTTTFSLIKRVHMVLVSLLKGELSYRKGLANYNIELITPEDFQDQNRRISRATWQIQENGECAYCRCHIALSRVIGLSEGQTGLCAMHGLHLVEQTIQKDEFTNIYCIVLVTNSKINTIINNINERVRAETN